MSVTRRGVWNREVREGETAGRAAAVLAGKGCERKRVQDQGWDRVAAEKGGAVRSTAEEAECEDEELSCTGQARLSSGALNGVCKRQGMAVREWRGVAAHGLSGGKGEESRKNAGRCALLRLYSLRVVTKN